MPIARTRMHLVLDRGDAEPYTQPLTSGKEAGEERDTDCVLPGFTVWPRRADWSLQQAVVRFAPPSHPSMLRAVLEGIACNHRVHVDALRQGFGAGEAHLQGMRVSLELRSVNHRYLDVRVRLPEFLAATGDPSDRRRHRGVRGGRRES